MNKQKYRVIGSFVMNKAQTGVLLEECTKPSRMVRIPWYDFRNLVHQGSIEDFILYQDTVCYCKGTETMESLMWRRSRYFWANTPSFEAVDSKNHTNTIFVSLLAVYSSIQGATVLVQVVGNTEYINRLKAVLDNIEQNVIEMSRKDYENGSILNIFGYPQEIAHALKEACSDDDFLTVNTQTANLVDSLSEYYTNGYNKMAELGITFNTIFHIKPALENTKEGVAAYIRNHLHKYCKPTKTEIQREKLSTVAYTLMANGKYYTGVSPSGRLRFNGNTIFEAQLMSEADFEEFQNYVSSNWSDGDILLKKFYIKEA